MKKFVCMFSLALGLMSVSSAALADLAGFLRSVNRQALSDVQKFNEKLSNQFGVPVPNVEAIVKSVPKPEDAFMILQLSQMSRKSPEVVMDKYQSGQGKSWGTLAKELGIKPGSREFHALKQGNLSFTGERRDDGDASERRHGEDKGKGREKEGRKDKDSEKRYNKEREKSGGKDREHGRDRD